MKPRSLMMALIAFLGWQHLVAAQPGQSPFANVPKSDCHVHLVDFLQNGEYWSEKEQDFVVPSPRFTPIHGQRGARIVSLLKRMDHANVRQAMVSGMPFVKKWSQTDPFRAKYYLDSSSRVVHARDTDYTVALAISDFLNSDQPEAQQARLRLYPFVSGFDSTDMGAVDMVVKRIKEFPGMWEGVGEVMSRHDDLTNLTTGERPSGNHPALHRLAHFAGAFHLPVSIHHNIGPVSPSGKPRDPLYLWEIIELFDAHPDTTFIWCHAGISRRVVMENLPAELLRVLSEGNRSRHVLIDLSWVVYENYIYNQPSDSYPVAVDNREIWAELISEFPDSFVIGSDMVAKFGHYHEEINKYAPFFETLAEKPNGEELVRKVAQSNFQTKMETLRQRRGGLGAKLDPDYQYPEENFTRTENGAYIIQRACPLEEEPATANSN